MAKRSPESLTHSSLRAVLSYLPETGQFTWVDNFHKSRIGRRAGGMNGFGYIVIMVGGRHYFAHRLAWLYMVGEWPIAQIDHINGDRADNRWCNLRAATPRQNKANSKVMVTNTSGYTGVRFRRKSGRWEAQIRTVGHYRFLGSFATGEEASAAYVAAAVSIHGEFARI